VLVLVQESPLFLPRLFEVLRDRGKPIRVENVVVKPEPVESVTIAEQEDGIRFANKSHGRGNVLVVDEPGQGGEVVFILLRVGPSRKDGLMIEGHGSGFGILPVPEEHRVVPDRCQEMAAVHHILSCKRFGACSTEQLRLRIDRLALSAGWLPVPGRLPSEHFLNHPVHCSLIEFGVGGCVVIMGQPERVSEEEKLE